jgi:predicted XRE-type DNA-binding protein
MVRNRLVKGEKPVHWVGSSKSDLLGFPADVVSEMGYALGVAQLCGKHPAAKPWKGEGAGVFELVESYEGNVEWAIYTVHFDRLRLCPPCVPEKIAVGHSHRPGGSLANGSNGRAGILKATTNPPQRARQVSIADGMIEGTGNVFADLGLPDAAGRRTKTGLAMAINAIVKERRLKQADTAAILGVPQPKVSALANYRLDHFSVEKLMGFLNALDQDVEIVIRPRREAVGHTLVFKLG